MKVTIYINESNYLLARHELVCMEEDAKLKRALVVAAEKARDTTTYIFSQLSDSQQVRLDNNRSDNGCGRWDNA